MGIGSLPPNQKNHSEVDLKPCSSALEAYNAKLTHLPYLDELGSRMEKCWTGKSCSLESMLRVGEGKEVSNQTSQQQCIAQSLWPDRESVMDPSRARTTHAHGRHVRTGSPQSVERRRAIGGEGKKGEITKFGQRARQIKQYSAEAEERRCVATSVRYLPKPPGRT